MAKGDAENAVRSYLLYLDDPAKVVDRSAVDQLQSELRGASDPIDKLRLLTKIRRLSEGNGEELRQAFCAHAREWAEANNVDPASFVELGVDQATMRAAGFTKAPSQSKVTPPGKRSRGQQPLRLGRVRVDDVKAIVAKKTGEFTLADLAKTSGGSPMTVRRAVEQLVDAGSVERLGPASDWAQQGRAPIVYRRAHSSRR